MSVPKINILLKVIFITFILVIGEGLTAQILPGDADNNGKVENVDFLYIGFGYGEIGPKRITPTDVPEEQIIQVLWDNIFPTGLNLAFADANGDGLVNYLDLFSAFQNYGTIQSTYSPPAYFQDEEGTPLFLDQRMIPLQVTQGASFELPLIFGPDNGAAQSFNGLAFTIEYNPAIIKNFSLDFSETWLGSNAELFKIIKTPEEGIIEVALTKLGDNPSYGNGDIGRASFVIEDDLADWLITPQDSMQTDIKITKVVYKAAHFEARPIFTQDVTIKLFHPDALLTATPTQAIPVISVFPNPTNSSVNISCDQTIKEINLFDLTGKRVFHQKYNQKEIALNHLAGVGCGLFLLHIITDEGKIMKKLIVQ